MCVCGVQFNIQLHYHYTYSKDNDTRLNRSVTMNSRLRERERKKEKKSSHVIHFVCGLCVEQSLACICCFSELIEKFIQKNFKSMGSEQKTNCILSHRAHICPIDCDVCFLSATKLCKCAQRWLHSILKLIHSVRCAVIHFLWFLLVRSFITLQNQISIIY